MKKLLLLPIVLLVYLEGISQVPLHTFFPMGVMGISYGDTLLNTSAVLRTAGIKKFTSIQTSYTDLRTGFSSITTYVTTNGKIEKVLSCMRRSSEKPDGICLRDTIMYDNTGRVVEYIYKDASGLTYLQCRADYSTGGKVKYTSIHRSYQQPVSDTDISYSYYNERGQLVRLVYDYGKGNKATPLSASIYYNEDRLPDSIHHDDPSIGTYFFKRKQKGKKKEVALETSTHLYKWVYNSSGQCISSQWGSQSRNTALRKDNPQYFNESAARYKYNDDGSLAKVIIKRDGKKVATLSYSYEK